jgi:hypothetical protein
MTRKRRAIVIGIALGIPWLVTGGCVGIESQYRYVDDYNKNYRPWISVEIAGNFRTRGIPFLFTYTDQIPPFDANFIYYTQDIVDGAELVIDRLAVRYDDGKEIDLTDQAPKVLAAEPFEMWYVDDHRQHKEPCLRVTWTIQRCIIRAGSFTVLLSGKLRKGDRILEPFDLSLNCKQFTETRFLRRWAYWALQSV